MKFFLQRFVETYAHTYVNVHKLNAFELFKTSSQSVGGRHYFGTTSFEDTFPPLMKIFNWYGIRCDKKYQ